MPRFVVNGATCRCLAGNRQAALIAQDQGGCAQMTGSYATIKDTSFDRDFGTCDFIGTCKPEFSSQWAGTLTNTPTMAETVALLDTAMLCCKQGGWVFIDDPGQMDCEMEIGVFDIENPITNLVMLPVGGGRAGMYGLRLLSSRPRVQWLIFKYTNSPASFPPGNPASPLNVGKLAIQELGKLLGIR